MAKMVDFEETIKMFFKEAIAWLEERPFRPRDGVDREKIAYEYMKMVSSDPRKYTKGNLVYSNIDKLEGFLEYCGVDKSGRTLINNELYIAVINVMCSISKYYEVNYDYTQMELMQNIKSFKIALNRKNMLKTTFYMMKAPVYFMQKQK